ncbi:MAG TPA: hypothetical protein VJK71_01205 [Gemmatimonadales bacterium]|nr:hypothetical protein [Gemmatimonadales bacterium]
MTLPGGVGGGLLGVLLLACSDPAGPSLSDEPRLVLQIIPGSNWNNLPNDQATITAARIAGSTLHLTVQYGGGCNSHRFALVAGTSFGESLPLYTMLRLAHDGSRDPCEALITRQLEVDLSPIVPLVQQAGGSALRFDVVEPDGRVSSVGELLLTF